MPNILVHLPNGAFIGPARAELVRRINAAAAAAEQLPPDLARRSLCWVVIEEAAPGAWTCGSLDITAQRLTCLAQVHVPAGVLDAASRALYVDLMHDAFRFALPADDPRPLVTSVLLHEVPDGCWGINGALWTLPDFARAAGYAHLQPRPQ